nr:hypothetical protein [Tanacetum cinerariifolium]
YVLDNVLIDVEEPILGIKGTRSLSEEEFRLEEDFEDEKYEGDDV